MSRARRETVALQILLVAIAFLASAGAASAQQVAGLLFNQVFNVGGVLSDPTANNGAGSVGCGGGTGGNLSTALNAALGGATFDGTQGLTSRRDLWRFCDNMTNNMIGGGAGPWTGATIPVTQVLTQNTGFAPAELFDQSEIAQSLGRWHSQNVVIRIQQLRIAQRGTAETPEVAVARQRAQPSDILTLAELIDGDRAGFFDEEARRGEANQRLLDDLQALSFSSTSDVLGVEGLGYFANARYHRLTADTTPNQRGSQTNGGGFTLGVDYRPNDASFVGGAFGYSRFSTDFDFNTGNSSTDDYAFMAFGNHTFGDEIYIDGIVRGSYMSISQTKLTPAFDGGPAFAPRNSDPSGWSVSADLGGGMDLARDAWRINPFVRIRVTHTSIGAFTETGGDGSINLSIGEQGVTSVPLTIGTSLSYNVSTGFGVVTPYVRAQYLHEFKDQVPVIRGFLPAIPGATFTLPPDATDRNYVLLGGGVTLALAESWSGFLDYDTLLAYTALNTHTVTLGVRRDF